MEVTCVIAWTEEEGDGEYIHSVALCDDDGEPVEGETVRTFYNADVALACAERMGDHRDIEVITDDLKVDP